MPLFFEKDNFSNFDSEFFEKNMRVNCLSHLTLSKAFFENLDKNISANIINLNDSAAQSINKSFFSYYVSKNAFLYASKLMASELAPTCRVNNLSLGTCY